MPDRDFPKVPDHREATYATVESAVLREMIERTLFLPRPRVARRPRAAGRLPAGCLRTGRRRLKVPPRAQRGRSPRTRRPDHRCRDHGQFPTAAARAAACHPAVARRRAGSTGSGKTTLALHLLEQLLEHGVPVLLIDRKGDLAGYTRPGWWQSIPDPDRRRRAEAFAARLDVCLFTPPRHPAAGGH